MKIKFFTPITNIIFSIIFALILFLNKKEGFYISVASTNIAWMIYSTLFVGGFGLFSVISLIWKLFDSTKSVKKNIVLSQKIIFIISIILSLVAMPSIIFYPFIYLTFGLYLQILLISLFTLLSILLSLINFIFVRKNLVLITK